MPTLSQVRYTNEDIGRIGEEMYHQNIRSKVMPQEKGKFLVMDIESGDYEVNADDLQAEKTLRARHPDGVLYGIRIGYTSAYSLSGRMIEEADE